MVCAANMTTRVQAGCGQSVLVRPSWCHTRLPQRVRRPLRNISARRGLAHEHAASRCGLRAARVRPCRAAAEAETATAEEEASETIADAPPPGPIPYAQDTETFQDVFAFSGALPERVNGRVAMWGFAAGVAAEFGSHESILQQAGGHLFGVTFFMLLISVASIMPKFASGVPIGELHNAASKGSLPGPLAFFNKTHEIWVGRVAMLGILGLVITEQTIKGGSHLFG